MENDNRSRLDRLEDSLIKLVGVVGRLTDHVRATDEFMARIAESQLRLAEAQNHNEEVLGKLGEKLHETQEKLDALIHIVDDQIRRRPEA